MRVEPQQFAVTTVCSRNQLLCKWARAQTHSGILLAIDFTGFYVSAHTGYSTLVVQVLTQTDGLINEHE